MFTLSLLSKEMCLYAGNDQLSSSICLSEGDERSTESEFWWQEKKTVRLYVLHCWCDQPVHTIGLPETRLVRYYARGFVWK